MSNAIAVKYRMRNLNGTCRNLMAIVPFNCGNNTVTGTSEQWLWMDGDVVVSRPTPGSNEVLEQGECCDCAVEQSVTGDNPGTFVFKTGETLDIVGGNGLSSAVTKTGSTVHVAVGVDGIRTPAQFIEDYAVAANVGGGHLYYDEDGNLRTAPLGFTWTNVTVNAPFVNDPDFPVQIAKSPLGIAVRGRFSFTFFSSFVSVDPDWTSATPPLFNALPVFHPARLTYGSGVYFRQTDLAVWPYESRNAVLRPSGDFVMQPMGGPGNTFIVDLNVLFMS